MQFEDRARETCLFCNDKKTDYTGYVKFVWDVDGPNSPVIISSGKVEAKTSSRYLHTNEGDTRIYYNPHPSEAVDEADAVTCRLSYAVSKTDQAGFGGLYLDDVAADLFASPTEYAFSVGYRDGTLVLPAIHAEDMIGNESYDCQYFTTADTGKPSVEYSSIAFHLEDIVEGPDPVTAVITLTASDPEIESTLPGSGINPAGYSSAVTINGAQMREEDSEDGTQKKQGKLSTEGNQSTLIMYVRDKEYEITPTAKDNVSNEGLGDPFPVGLTRPADVNQVGPEDYAARFEYGDNGCVYTGYLSLGSLYASGIGGVGSIAMELSIPGSDSSGSLTLGRDLILSTTREETHGEDTLYLLPFEITVTDIEPHAEYNLSITTSYTTEDAAGNSLQETVYRKTGPAANRPVVMSGGVLAPFDYENPEDRDAELDKLSGLEAEYRRFDADDAASIPLMPALFTDPDGDTVYLSKLEYPQGSGRWFVLVTEEFTQSGSQKRNTYLVKDRCFIADNSIDMDSIGVRFFADEDPQESRSIFNTNTVWAVLDRQEYDDPSGIHKAEVFVYEGTDAETAYSEGSSLYLIQVNGSTSQMCTLQSAAESAEIQVGLRVEDGAGNYGFKDYLLTIDTQSPGRIGGGPGNERILICVDSADMVYSYSENAEQRTICLELSNAYLEANNDIDYSLSGVSIVNAPVTAISAECAADGSVVFMPDGDYVPNERIDFNLTFHDYAGNTTENLLSVYTPGRLHQGTAGDIEGLFIDTHHNRPYGDYDERGNYLSFTAQDTGDYASLRIYPEEDGMPAGEPLPETGSLSWEASGLASHGEYGFFCYSVNGSGYENREPGSFGSISVTTGNNSPAFSPIGTATFIIDDDDVLFFNGNSEITVPGILDHDVADAHRLSLHVDDRAPVEYGFDEYTVRIGDIEDEEFELSDGEEYSLTLGVTDLWGSGDAQQHGSEVFYDWDDSNELSFTFDGAGPVSDGHRLVRESGYAHINGDLFLNIDDSLCGLAPDTVEIKKGMSVSSMSAAPRIPTTELPFNYSVTLDEGQYDLLIEAQDMLGNSAVVFQKFIIVDKTPPVVKALALPEDDNPQLVAGTNLLSNGHAKWSIDWEDVNSPTSVAYRYMVGASVAFSGTLDIEGLSETTGSGTVVVDLPNYAADLSEHTIYTLQLSLCDQAGNWSAFDASPVQKTVRYDLAGPLITLAEPWDVITKAGVHYITSNSITEPVISVTDSAGTPFLVRYALYDAAEGTRSTEYADVGDIVLASDGAYVLHVIARDDAYHQNTLLLPFQRDTQGPMNISAALIDEKKISYVPGDTVTVNFSGSDVESYYYRFINTDDTVLTLGAPGADAEGWIAVPQGLGTGYPVELPAIGAAVSNTAILKVKASDVAGNQSGILVPADGNFAIETGSEALIVRITPWIGGRVDEEGNSYCIVLGSWQHVSGTEHEDSITGYHYTLFKNNQAVSEGSTSTPLVYIRNENPLHDDEYRFEVYGIMDSGRETSVFSSVTGRVDTVKPVINEVTAGAFASTDNLRVSWDIAQTGDIASITPIVHWYRTEMVDGEEIEVAYTGFSSPVVNVPVGSVLLPDAYATGVIVDGDIVEVQFSVCDHAGNVSTLSTNAIVIDNTPPEAFGVVDQGEYVNPGKNELYFDWLWSADDLESPIETTWYQLTENGVIDENAWVQLGGSGKELTVEEGPLYDNGSLIILAVKKVNAAGLSTVGMSNGIILDSTAGKIHETYFSLSGETSPLTYYTTQQDLTLWVSGADEQSGVIRITGELGYFEGCTWVPYDIDGVDDIDVETEETNLEIHLPDALAADTLFRYKVVLYNGAGDPSLPGYSKALWYNPDASELSNVKARYHNGIFSVTWDSSLTLPFLSGSVVLLDGAGNPVSAAQSLESDSGVYTLDTRDMNPQLADGNYRFQVQLQDMTTATMSDVSNLVVKDTTAPVLTGLSTDPFVAQSLDFVAHASETVASFAYKLGSVTDDDMLTGDWVSVPNAGSNVNMYDIDLSILDGLGYLDQSQILLTLRCWDTFGNESSIVTGLSTVDLTPATVPVVSKDLTVSFFNTEFELSSALDFSPTSLHGLEWMSEDTLSGVTAYQWTVVDAENIDGGVVPPIAETDWHGPYPLHDAVSYRGDFDGLALEDGQMMYAIIRVRNGSGLYSAPGMSDVPVSIDLAAPQCSITAAGYEAGITLKENGDALPTYNENGLFELVIDEERSDIIHYTMELTDPSNILVSKTEGMMLNDMTIDQVMALSFTPGKYGEYRIKMTLHDPGMNRSIMETVVRYNAPPFGILPDLVEANPARPFSLKGRYWFSDSDNMSQLSYEILDGETVLWTDDETAFENGEFSADMLSTSCVHTDFHNQLTQYEFRVTASDSFGAQATHSIPLHVVNTREGMLYTSEYWSG
ncbi:MAG: Ig-like domain repeat protein, partial [Spirochaetales bacterium]|nr:Ig-like domain repeat protein [Spirochaetales bacterium]